MSKKLAENATQPCSICHEIIPPDLNGWRGGHNAWPVVENGRCCGDCNATVVIPTRLGLKPLKRIDEHSKS